MATDKQQGHRPKTPSVPPRDGKPLRRPEDDQAPEVHAPTWPLPKRPASHPGQGDDFGDVPDAGDDDDSAKAVDPGALAARLMLRQAAGDRGMRARLRAPAGLTVVAVPGPGWLDPVIARWQVQFRSGVDPNYGSSRNRRAQRWEWISIRRDGSDRNHVPDKGNSDIAQAASVGLAVVGFSPSPDTQLPRYLTGAADCRVDVLPMDEALLRSVIRGVTGRSPTVAIPDGLPAALTPDMLRLARRSRQSAAGYLARLVALAGQVRPRSTERQAPSLDDVHGMDAAKGWGERWVRDLADYRAGRIAWADVHAAALLHGPPGTGKTMFAQALAGTAGVPLVSASLARWQASDDGHLGDCLNAMRASFDEAKRRAPCILLIDEIDAIGTRSGDKGKHRDYWTAVVTGLLELLDGTDGREGVLVIATTNDPGALDPALVRSGRLDRRFAIGHPDASALEGILRHHLGADLVADDITPVARLALGGTGADCARWVRGARQAARHAQRPMRLDDLRGEVGPSCTVPPEVERCAAVHEAGHAVVMALLRPGDLMEISIAPDARARAGTTTFRPDIRSTREAVHGTLLELLAGRAAEAVILGGYSGGSGGSASSDLALATCCAVALETALGLGDLGPLWVGMPDADTVGTMLAMRPALAARVRERLEAVYGEAVGLVGTHRDAVAAVADALSVARSLTGEEILDLVTRHPPGTPPGELVP